GCLGALDGTFVQVQVPLSEKPRYRNRKGDVSVNVLGVCDQNMNYIFLLTGWEGSAAESRVLRDAITRRNCLKIPNGQYYLCDGGYTNGPGLLAPCRGVRYHLNEWRSGAEGPHNFKELFNLHH
ncbi:putative nuclease harbi1, partial [Phtheirospermum japonicum]